MLLGFVYACALTPLSLRSAQQVYLFIAVERTRNVDSVSRSPLAMSAKGTPAGYPLTSVIRRPDAEQQAHLENITFASVSEDDLRLYSDQCFLNLFRLSQLLLEYLLSVQDTLATSLEVSDLAG